MAWFSWSGVTDLWLFSTSKYKHIERLQLATFGFVVDCEIISNLVRKKNVKMETIEYNEKHPHIIYSMRYNRKFRKAVKRNLIKNKTYNWWKYQNFKMLLHNKEMIRDSVLFFSLCAYANFKNILNWHFWTFDSRPW